MGAEVDKRRILIVDDEPNIVSSLRRLLGSEDRQVLTAKDAEGAWSLLKEQGEVEVIVCDNKLPGMTGIEFLTKAKRLYPDTVKILMTGYPDLNSAMDAINRAHIWRYVQKPVEVEELKLLVKQAFDYYRILRQNRLLLQVVRQQEEWLKALKEQHGAAVTEEMQQKAAIDPKRIGEIVEEVLKRYMEQDNK